VTLEQLAKVGSLEAQTAARSRIAELAPALRFCRYKGGLAGGAPPAAAAGEGVTSGADPVLAARLEALLDAEAARAAAAAAAGGGARPADAAAPLSAAGSEVFFEGVLVAVHCAAARSALAAAAAAARELDAAPPPSPERRLALFDKLLLALSEAQSGAKEAAAAEPGRASELRALDAALRCLALRRTGERNAVMFEEALARWRAPPAAAAGAAKRRRYAAAARAEAPAARIADVIHLADACVASAVALGDLAASAAGFAEAFGDSAAGAAAAAALGAAAEAEEGALRCRRAAALAAWHERDGREGEAAALYARAAAHGERAAETARALGGRPGGGGVAAAHAARCLAAAEAARDDARRGRLALLVRLAESRAAEAAALARGLGGVGLEEEEAWEEGPPHVLDALDLFESALEFGQPPAAGAAPPITAARLFPIPPSMSCCAVGPVLLDTALLALPLPSVAHRAPAAPASRLGRLTAGLWAAGGYLRSKK